MKLPPNDKRITFKACSKCGAVYPLEKPKIKCPQCGTFFDIVRCSTCGCIVSGSDNVKGKGICRDCHNSRERVEMVKSRKRVKERFSKRYEDYLLKIRQIPRDYHPLTQAEWLRVCNHFNGCARCGDAGIAAREFFVPFKDGGRYCEWNIIPVCDKCLGEWASLRNPFKLARSKDDNRNKSLVSDNWLNRRNTESIVDYLEPIVDRIIGDINDKQN